ncbi:DUF2490 domain-containing protein [Puteibacter caeruleilacunae]|nr:DUF2490 domain-containing protein [Puteibacter caeruleilacunae]
MLLKKDLAKGYCSKVFSLLVLMLILIPNVKGEDDFYEHKDVWQTYYVSHSFNSKWSTLLLYNNMYSTKVGTRDVFIQNALKYKLTKELYLEGIYRYEYTKGSNGWISENRPAVRMGLDTKWGQWKIRNRHRVELRLREHMSSRFRYRTDIRLKPSWNFSSFKISPYWMEEAFVSDHKISALRTYLGLAGSKGRFVPCTYFMVQSYNKQEKFKHLMVYGVQLGIKI